MQPDEKIMARLKPGCICQSIKLIRLLDAIDQGASTGAIESRFFPSFRESTIKLEQVQQELGLDVIGSVTFGALSKGELDLALATALPTGLQPAQLREFLVNKKAAQEKLQTYYTQQIDFLDQGGTIAGFVRQQGRQELQAAPDVEAEDGSIAVDADGNKVILQNGQWAPFNG